MFLISLPFSLNLLLYERIRRHGHDSEYLFELRHIWELDPSQVSAEEEFLKSFVHI